MENRNACALLCSELNTVILKSDVKYADVIKALKWLQIAYQDKGENLLNGVDIQEVSAYEQHQSVKLP